MKYNLGLYQIPSNVTTELKWVVIDGKMYYGSV